MRLLALGLCACAEGLRTPRAATLSALHELREAGALIDRQPTKEDFVYEVMHKELDGAIVEGWARNQRRLTAKLRKMFRPYVRKVRVLVAMPVSNRGEDAVVNFEYNMQKLQNNSFGDVFDYALFHYDDDATEWEKKPWYKDTNGPVVRKWVGPICKSEAWYQLEPSLIKQYDYVWLVDGDLRFDYFSWDLYRTVLSMLNPLVSQPSFLPAGPGGRSTDIGSLQMSGKDKATSYFTIAKEAERSESMAVLVSTQLWGAVRLKLGSSDRSSVWCINDIWDAAALTTRYKCKEKTGIVVVNASPLRHMNFHDLLAKDTPGQRNRCTGNHGLCQDLTPGEVALMRDELKGYCDMGDHVPFAGRADIPDGLQPAFLRRHFNKLSQWTELPNTSPAAAFPTTVRKI